MSISAFMAFMMFSCSDSGDAQDQMVSESSDNLEEGQIIFQDSLGNQVTRETLKGADGTYTWELVFEDQNIPEEAYKLHEEGRQLGGEGNYEEASKKLTAASKLAQEWPYPVYDLAYTYLLQQDYLTAYNLYAQVDKMVPGGFFTTKTAMWSLRREINGVYPGGLYKAYLQIEQAPNNEEKLKIARALANNYPTYVPAWKDVASYSTDPAERLHAIRQGLNQHPDLESHGVLVINWAIVLNQQGNKQDAINLLGNLIIGKQTTHANREMAKYVLSTMI